MKEYTKAEIRALLSPYIEKTYGTKIRAIYNVPGTDLYRIEGNNKSHICTIRWNASTFLMVTN